MAIKSATINLLAFPQRWEPPVLSLNALILPKGDPLAMAPAFPECVLALEAAVIAGLDALPTAAAVALRVPLAIATAANRPALFTALAAQIPVRAHAAVVPAHPPIRVKKAAVSSYAATTAGARPRSSALASADEYACVLHDDADADPAPGDAPATDFYWEEIYGFVLRQPVLARELGLVYEASLTLDDPTLLARGGFVYIDLGAGSDYAALSRAVFAARIPALAAARRVFAPVLFPVDEPGNFDHVTAEAAAYDDGHAKIVHGMQPRLAAVAEASGRTAERLGSVTRGASPSTLPPVKDLGIRLGWDDEQVSIWMNRQLGVDAYDPGSPTVPGAPLGIAGYRVDVRDDGAAPWQSLSAVQADLALAEIPLGRFDGELWVDTLPANINNKQFGEFWLPSFFATWAGGSLVVTDRTPYEIAGHPEIVKDAMYQAVGADAVMLRYGRTYQFRVRLADLTGGGPDVADPALNPAHAAIATVPFRRYSPPKAVHARRTDGAGPAARAHVQIARPMLGYPDVVFTDFYADPIGELTAQAAVAESERREPLLPDPDATQLRIDIEVQSLVRDPAAGDATAAPFVHVLSTVRDFPADPTQPIELDLEATDVHTLDELRANPAAAGDPLLVPSARAVRLVFTAIGGDRPGYWGSDEARIGAAPVSICFTGPSADERNLLLPPALGPQIQGIFLQPDPLLTTVDRAGFALGGIRSEAPSDLMSRLAAQLDVPHRGLALSSPRGTRTVFAASSGIRHTLSPDGSSISFASVNDLARHWLVALRFTIDRDWTWDALASPAFDVLRDGTPVGSIELPRVLGDTALPDGDRDHTSVVFLDGFDPKPGPPPEVPAEIQTSYALVPRYRTPPAVTDEPYVWPLRLPITTPPRQTPKLVSAGWAFGPYSAAERYRSTRERPRMLYLQFDGLPADENDRYFARVLAYGPDPMLLEPQQRMPDPPEPPLPIDPEHIRSIAPGQSNDLAGYQAMQPLELASGDAPGCYVLPLPGGTAADAPELFGFYVYELRVGHDRSRWCTAQGRFGPPLRVAGVQHPAPALRVMATRSRDAVSVVCPYAAAVVDGRNLRAVSPRTQMHALLYAQVLQVDGQSWRNVLLARAHGSTVRPDGNHDDPRRSPALMRFSQDAILPALRGLGLPLDAPLSVIAVELLPATSDPAGVPDPMFAEPLGRGLGQVRILRTSTLTPVPDICPPEDAA